MIYQFDSKYVSLCLHFPRISDFFFNGWLWSYLSINVFQEYTNDKFWWLDGMLVHLISKGIFLFFNSQIYLDSLVLFWCLASLIDDIWLLYLSLKELDARPLYSWVSEPFVVTSALYKTDLECSGKVKLVNSINPLAFRFTFTIID